MPQVVLPPNTDLLTNGGNVNLGNGKLNGCAGGVNNAAVDTPGTGAGALDPTKTKRRIEKVAVLSDHATTAAAIRKQIHRAYAAGTILDFEVVASVANIGAATVTIDLKKNGVTVLTPTITLDNGTAAFIGKAPAGYTATAYVAGDVFEAEITAVAAGGGTIAKGVSCYLYVDENPF